MTWSIYKNTERDVKDWEPCYAAFYIDHDMETNHYPNRIKFLHDGYVDVYFDGDFVTCKVTDGRWDSQTERQIIGLVSKTYWGDFVEGFYKRDGKIHVVMGS
jgi:hypothetical protein